MIRVPYALAMQPHDCVYLVNKGFSRPRDLQGKECDYWPRGFLCLTLCNKANFDSILLVEHDVLEKFLNMNNGMFFSPYFQDVTHLRIDNSRQGMIRATLLHSAAILSTVSCYTSNCR